MCRVGDFQGGQLETKFYVEWLLFAPIAMDHWMGEWLYYNFAAESFHKQTL